MITLRVLHSWQLAITIQMEVTKQLCSCFCQVIHFFPQIPVLHIEASNIRRSHIISVHCNNAQYSSDKILDFLWKWCYINMAQRPCSINENNSQIHQPLQGILSVVKVMFIQRRHDLYLPISFNPFWLSSHAGHYGEGPGRRCSPFQHSLTIFIMYWFTTS